MDRRSTSSTRRWHGLSDSRLRVWLAVLTVGIFCASALITAATAAAGEVPFDFEAPEVEVVGGGAPKQKERLSCNPGSWSGANKFSYEWLRSGAPIESATSALYIISSADRGRTLSCIVTGENGYGSYSEESYNSFCIEGPCKVTGTAPTNSAAPKIEGTVQTGHTVTCSTGSWSGEPRPEYTFEWLQEGTRVGTGNTFTISEANRGYYLQCRVEATNSYGHASVPSAAVKVPGAAPAVVKEPEVLGVAALGETLTCSPGKWSGSPSPSFTYAWFLTSGAKTARIEGAGAQTFVVQESDEGSSLSCEVTGTNHEGETHAKSANSVAVPETAPKAVTPPEIAGTASLGSKLTCLSGEWKPNTPALKLRYYWLRDGAEFAEGSTYTVAPADQAHTLSCEVTGTNGSNKTNSATSTGIYIPGTPPKDEQSPTITGTAAVGQELGCSPGTWSGNPAPTYSFQWLDGGEPIRGATSSTYTVPEGDQLHTLACEVTATNAAGKMSAKSASKTVSGTAPVNTAQPTVTGARAVGGTLHCSTGTWTGNPTPTYTFEWLLGTRVVGHESILHVPAEDEGQTLVCSVTATNVAGARTRESEPIVIKKSEGGEAPQKEQAPSIANSGLAVGDALTCRTGKWSGEPSYTFEWLRGSTVIEGATEAQYVVTKADEGYALACVVTAVNSYGSGSATSTSVTIAPEAPSFSGPPQIEGKPQIGETLRCHAPAPSGEPAPKVAFAWMKEGEPIASVSSFQVPSEDAEKEITCEVTASNAGGTVTERSGAVKIAGSAPRPKELPEISPQAAPKVGQTLTCENESSSWEGAPAPTFTYVWLRNGLAITSPSAKDTYVVSSEDEGHSLSCSVTGRNGQGSDSAESGALKVVGKKPSEVVAPTLSGTALVGGVLTCTRGSWQGEPVPERYSYRWLLNETPIPGAKGEGETLAVEAAWAGKTLACEVTATNVEGKASAQSEAEEVSTALTAPHVGQPKLEGTPEVKQLLTCIKGTVEGEPAPEVSYQWLREGEPIRSQTATTYEVQIADLGHDVSCEVKAVNTAGTASATSVTVHVPGIAPEATTGPQVSGRPYVEEQLYCESGAWNAKPTPEYDYEWLANGNPIPNATGKKYSIEPSQVGETIACRVIVTNTEGSASATSEPTAQVTVRPAHKFEPAKEETEETPPPKKVAKKPSIPTPEQILAGLEGQLAGAQQNVRFGTLMKKGSYSFAFSALTAGTLSFSWYELPKAAHSSSSKRKPLIVATASVAFSSASKLTVNLHLTSVGRRLIRKSKHLKLTAKGVFTVPGRSPVTWVKTFVLSR